METNNNNNNDLLTQLANETETKLPGDGNKVINSDFWDKKPEETETPEEKKPEKETEAPEEKKSEKETKTAETEEVKPVPERPKKLDKEVKEASARTMVQMVDFTQKLIFTPIVNYKARKKFTDAEVNRLDESNIEDANKESLEGEDLALRNKWDRVMKRRDKKLKDIPFTDPEIKDLTTACFNYMDVKQKELPPEYFLALTIATIVGKRAIDVVFD